MRRARARVLNGRRRPLRDTVSEGQKKGRAFPYNNRALNTQVSQCNAAAKVRTISTSMPPDILDGGNHLKKTDVETRCGAKMLYCLE
ncbi:hypothetical protein NDU88_003643 [Pleurodeles waltl]|uniref:Uncharacterized protein n=1 Tax=Pleurodeles waltl TaxID=8319 RepID=A0AAV7VHC0_PLEWA|nr:hypothetical protein NDU88_003643 [Pleurodeles waltl]